MRNLARRPDCEPAVLAGRRQHAACFYRRSTEARGLEPSPVDHHVGVGEGLVDRAGMQLVVQIAVARHIRMDLRHPMLEGRVRIDDRRQRVIVDR